MCGNCLLQETAFICPMECPKGMRNGPCGGITPDKNCYVDETRKCIWYAIYERALKKGREELLLEVLPPLDWEKVGTETWGEVVRQIRKVGTGKYFQTTRPKIMKCGIVFLKLSGNLIGGEEMKNIIRQSQVNQYPVLRKDSVMVNL
jgi:hypothetical protein